MLFSLIFVVLVAQIKADLSAALNDPQALLSVYSQYRIVYPRPPTVSASGDRLRFSLFKKSLQFAENQNRKGLGWTSGLNKFSDMTVDEVKLYEGVNNTGLAAPHPLPTPSKGLQASGDYQYPEETNWLKSVFEPQDQGNCGSCWIFGSISSLEGRYHKLTGKLKKFSEQHMLDCVFDWRADGGCAGGANYCTFDYIGKGHPIIREAAYPAYSAKEGKCREGQHSDTQKAARYVSWVQAHRTEEGLLVALAGGVVAVGFETTPAFRAYSHGVIRDESCLSYRTSHAVTAVGYTKEYVLVKNSWGNKWGESGFVRFGRNHHGCSMMKNALYPIFELTGETDDDPSNTPTSFNPNYNDKPNPIPTCRDEYPSWFCHKSKCSSKDATSCAKTCDRCSFDKNTCPRGKTMCADATCKSIC